MLNNFSMELTCRNDDQGQKQLLYGISTYFPGLARFHSKGTGGTNSARYCYAAWLRHLVMANKNVLLVAPPKIVG